MSDKEVSSSMTCSRSRREVIRAAVGAVCMLDGRTTARQVSDVDAGYGAAQVLWERADQLLANPEIRRAYLGIAPDR
jgi:hypothetical protein